MKSYSLLHLDDHVLLRDLATLVSQDRATTAALLAHLAEVEERRLYARAAYPSMYLYCVRELRMSEDTAYRRIGVARTARQFPAIFPALADGRLNVTAVLLLTPHLTPQVTQEKANELLAAAAGKTKDEIRLLLAQLFPQPDMPTLVLAVQATGVTDELSAGPVGAVDTQLALERVGGLALQQVPTSPAPSAIQMAPEQVVRAKVSPLSPGRFALQVTIDQETYEQLRYAQLLLGHAVPSGDVATVLKRSLGLLVEKLEQKKFAKCARSRPRRSSANGRYVPAEIRRTVWQRDGGQCTFLSEKGRRCEERTRLEFDHIDPVARGGQTTVDRMQLRCRAHNQYTAECTFGPGFMHEKREAARRRTARPPAQTRAHTQAQEQMHAREQTQAEERTHVQAQSEAAAASAADVIACLRELRFSPQEARRGAELCAHIPDAPLEERVRVALRGLAPNCVRRPAPVSS